MGVTPENTKKKAALIKELLFAGYTFEQIDKLREYKREFKTSSFIFVVENPEHFENIGFVRRK